VSLVSCTSPEPYGGGIHLQQVGDWLARRRSDSHGLVQTALAGPMKHAAACLNTKANISVAAAREREMSL